MSAEIITERNAATLELLQPHPRELILALVEFDDILNQKDGHKSQTVKARAFDFMGYAYVDLAAWNQLLFGLQKRGDFEVGHALDFSEYNTLPLVHTYLGKIPLAGGYVISVFSQSPDNGLDALGFYLGSSPNLPRLKDKYFIRVGNDYYDEEVQAAETRNNQLLVKLAHALGLGGTEYNFLGRVGYSFYFFNPKLQSYRGAHFLGESQDHQSWAIRTFTETDIPWDKLGARVENARTELKRQPGLVGI